MSDNLILKIWYVVEQIRFDCNWIWIVAQDFRSLHSFYLKYNFKWEEKKYSLRAFLDFELETPQISTLTHDYIELLLESMNFDLT